MAPRTGATHIFCCKRNAEFRVLVGWGEAIVAKAGSSKEEASAAMCEAWCQISQYKATVGRPTYHVFPYSALGPDASDHADQEPKARKKAYKSAKRDHINPTVSPDTIVLRHFESKNITVMMSKFEHAYDAIKRGQASSELDTTYNIVDWDEHQIHEARYNAVLHPAIRSWYEEPTSTCWYSDADRCNRNKCHRGQLTTRGSTPSKEVSADDIDPLYGLPTSAAAHCFLEDFGTTERPMDIERDWHQLATAFKVAYGSGSGNVTVEVPLDVLFEMLVEACHRGVADPRDTEQWRTFSQAAGIVDHWMEW